VQIPAIAAAAVTSDSYLLDVRELDEWSAGHAPEAVHVPMMEIPGRIEEIPREGEVVVVCRVGSRSGQVVAFLRHNGFENVVNLDGGMASWSMAGRPVVTDDGQPGQVI
jgi:rhodanese-related sulfurtransferase